MPASHWVNTWITMLQLTEYSNVPNPPFIRLPSHSILPVSQSHPRNSTIRQMLQTSISASSDIHVWISNVFGVNRLPITQVGVGHPFNDSTGTLDIIPGYFLELVHHDSRRCASRRGSEL